MNIDPKAIKLIYDMLRTINDLGRSPMARIDARLWATHYERRIKRLYGTKTNTVNGRTNKRGK